MLCLTFSILAHSLACLAPKLPTSWHDNSHKMPSWKMEKWVHIPSPVSLFCISATKVIAYVRGENHSQELRVSTLDGQLCSVCKQHGQPENFPAHPSLGPGPLCSEPMMAGDFLTSWLLSVAGERWRWCRPGRSLQREAGWRALPPQICSDGNNIFL